MIHDHIEDYSLQPQLIGAEEAVRITSAVGMKGDETNEEVCDPALYAKGVPPALLWPFLFVFPVLLPCSCPALLCLLVSLQLYYTLHSVSFPCMSNAHLYAYAYAYVHVHRYQCLVCDIRPRRQNGVCSLRGWHR